MSKKPWRRCTVTGEPISRIDRSDWISMKDRRSSIEARFPDFDEFCLTCSSIMAEYDEKHVRYALVYDATNPLHLGSAQLVSGNPGEGYVFAGHTKTLMAIGDERRARKQVTTHKRPTQIACPRCGKIHML